MRQLGIFGDEYGAEAEPRRDRTVADRVARHVALRAEIGPLPPVADGDRKAACRTDLAAFGVAYCRATEDWLGILEREPSAELRAYAADLQRAVTQGGLMHTRLPRGGGKTAWAKIALLWGLSYGHIRFGVCFAASDRLASEILRNVWDVVERSPNYLADFPEIAYPVRMLEGKFQRMPTQTLDGARTAIRYTHDTIHLPTVAGSDASGATIVARGAGSAVRGLVKGGSRPDFAILDDIQTREDARNQATTRKLADWVQGDVLGLAGARQMACVMTSTPICDGDLSETYADPTQAPAWRTISRPMVLRWPQAADLWDAYAELWRQSILDGDPAATAAAEYYRERRAAMDDGAQVFDSGNYDPRTELSAIQHAMNLRLRCGDAAFEAEYQLVPPKLASVVSVTASQVANQLNHAPRGVLPQGTLVALAYLDVMGDAGIHWTVAAFGPRQTAAVIDYGRWPDSGRLVPENAPERECERLVAAGCAAVLDRLLATEWHRADGTAARLHAAWIDHGWLSKVLVRLAAIYRARGHANVWTCKGWPSAGYAEGRGKNVVAKGWQVDFRERDGVRFSGQNADYWKETAQRAFTGIALQPGTLSLWGDRPSQHEDFAGQMTAETLADKAVSARGVEMYRWTQRPGAVNHWLDTTAGCLAAASWYRFWDGTDVAASAIPKVGDGGAKVPSRMVSGASAARRRWRSAKASE